MHRGRREQKGWTEPSLKSIAPIHHKSHSSQTVPHRGYLSLILVSSDVLAKGRHSHSTPSLRPSIINPPPFPTRDLDITTWSPWSGHLLDLFADRQKGLFEAYTRHSQTSRNKIAYTAYAPLPPQGHPQIQARARTRLAGMEMAVSTPALPAHPEPPASHPASKLRWPYQACGIGFRHEKPAAQCFVQQRASIYRSPLQQKSAFTLSVL